MENNREPENMLCFFHLACFFREPEDCIVLPFLLSKWQRESWQWSGTARARVTNYLPAAGSMLELSRVVLSIRKLLMPRDCSLLPGTEHWSVQVRPLRITV